MNNIFDSLKHLFRLYFGIHDKKYYLNNADRKYIGKDAQGRSQFRFTFTVTNETASSQKPQPKQFHGLTPAIHNHHTEPNTIRIHLPKSKSVQNQTMKRVMAHNHKLMVAQNNKSERNLGSNAVFSANDHKSAVNRELRHDLAELNNKRSILRGQLAKASNYEDYTKFSRKLQSANDQYHDILGRISGDVVNPNESSGQLPAADRAKLNLNNHSNNDYQAHQNHFNGHKSGEGINNYLTSSQAKRLSDAMNGNLR